MSRIYDLHCHSDQSDGSLSPETLVSRAKQLNVAVLALTDHDTVAGFARARQQAVIDNIELICGIEFSCEWERRGVHIVGLNIDPHSDILLDITEKQAALREQRAEQIAERFARAGIRDALEGAKAFASDGVIGRPHFADFLVQSGHCKDRAQAFQRYLGAGKLGDVKHIWPEMAHITGVILAAGGVPVMAHPSKYNMTRTKLCAMVAHFKDSGGVAIEVVSGVQRESTTRDLAGIARRYDLLSSCGSDFHVPGAKWQELGNFSPLPQDSPPVWTYWE